jgi:putative DNA primase/helicase
LPRIQKASIVFVVEGEKDVDTLYEHGFIATTNAGGANAPWLPQYSESLHGREVIVIPDNDTPGRQRGVKIARALFGCAKRLRTFRLDDCKDVSDWFGRGHSEREFIYRLEKEAEAR